MDFAAAATAALPAPLTSLVGRDTEVRAALRLLSGPGVRLLSLVASHEGGEACICDLNPALDLSQLTISHHLKVLHEVGLLDREKRGVWVYYRVQPEALASLATLIGSAGA